MNRESILLLTKDAMCTSYFPCYGNEYWKGKTPNMDELVEKGTVFTVPRLPPVFRSNGYRAS